MAACSERVDHSKEKIINGGSEIYVGCDPQLPLHQRVVDDDHRLKNARKSQIYSRTRFRRPCCVDTFFGALSCLFSPAVVLHS